MSDAHEVYERGIAVRDEMLGSEHGRAKVESAVRLHADFENMVTRYCFGEVWTREALPRAQRSMITLAMLIALGRPHEIRVHVKGAITNGVTKEQISEIIMHSVDLLRGPGCRRRLPQRDGDARRARAGVSSVAPGSARRLRRPRQHGRADGAQPRHGRLRAHAATTRTRRAGADRGRARRRRGRVAPADFAARGRRRDDAARRPRRRGGDARVGGRHRLRAAPGSRASST